MTIRDVQWSFTDTSSGATTSIVGAAATYLAPNSLDTAPLGAYLTELTASDTQLSANVNTYRELGGGARMWLVIDWITAPNNLTSVDMQLITSASASLSAPVVIYDFTAVVIATLVAGYRQIAALPRTTAWLQYLGLQAITLGTTSTTGAYVAWIGWDVDAVDQGGASGYSIK